MASSPTVFDDVAPWPETAKPAEAAIGHNKPPVEDDVRAQFREKLLDERPTFLQRVEEIDDASNRVEVKDDETLGKAGDLVKMIRAAVKHVDETHRAVKAPYLAAGRTCDSEKNTLVDRLDAAKRRAERPMNDYVSRKEAERRAEEARIREEQRRQAEEAAKRQAEIEAAAKAGDEEALAAAAPVAEPVAAPVAEPVRSDTGTAVSGRTTWNARVEDYEVAFMQVSDDDRVREAIDKAVAARVRAGTRKMEGVAIWPTTSAVSR